MADDDVDDDDDADDVVVVDVKVVDEHDDTPRFFCSRLRRKRGDRQDRCVPLMLVQKMLCTFSVFLFFPSHLLI